jgi:hypothetical protein
MFSSKSLFQIGWMGIVGLPDPNESAPDYPAFLCFPVFKKKTTASEQLSQTSQCSFPLTEYIIRVADPHNFNE